MVEAFIAIEIVAQVASIILFNPLLLDSSPKNLDHIKLMNNFFKFLNY